MTDPDCLAMLYLPNFNGKIDRDVTQDNKMLNTDRLSLQLIFAPLDLFAPCRLVGVVMVELLSLYDIKAKQMRPPISERGTWLRFCFTQVPFSIMKQLGTWGWGGLEGTVQYLELFQCLCHI